MSTFFSRMIASVARRNRRVRSMISSIDGKP
jgi:hypothetical protein